MSSNLIKSGTVVKLHDGEILTVRYVMNRYTEDKPMGGSMVIPAGTVTIRAEKPYLLTKRLVPGKYEILSV